MRPAAGNPRGVGCYAIAEPEAETSSDVGFPEAGRSHLFHIVSRPRMVDGIRSSLRNSASAIALGISLLLLTGACALPFFGAPLYAHRTGKGIARKVQLDGTPCIGRGSVLALSGGDGAVEDPCSPPSDLSGGSGIEGFGTPKDEVDEHKASAQPSLFCFCVAMTFGYEVGLVQAQYAANSSIFACDAWDVFSLEPITISPGIPSTAIPGAPAVWKELPGKGYNMSFNTNVFIRAWRHIHEDGKYKSNDWVVKVDVDAVFFPGRLRTELSRKEWSWTSRWHSPVYFKNCWAFHSMQGPLEILSRAAAEVLLAGMDTCKRSITVDSLGEDQFMDKCLHTLGVQSVNNFEVLSDFYCKRSSHAQPCDCTKATDRTLAFHPCKSIKSYFRCESDVTEASEKEMSTSLFN